MREEKIDPDVNLLEQLDRIVGKVEEPKAKIKVLAMDVCVASSIYADMSSKDGMRWTEAYHRGMEIAYTKIKDLPELVRAIAVL
jgi:hypothetical protein